MFEFWLKNETTGEELLLPVTPEGYEYTDGMEIETVRATEMGDLNVTGRRKPKQLTLESFFPAREYPFARGNAGLLTYPEMLRRWIGAKDIVRAVIADETGSRVNEQFYIEELTVREKMEDNGDMPYSIRLRQYTPMQVTPVGNQPTASQPRKDAATAAPPKKKSYTVKKGDCLSAIARAVYGDAGQWKKIYEANKDVIGKNPNLIFPGQTYRIP